MSWRERENRGKEGIAGERKKILKVLQVDSS
jgi:hypothetical protein